MGWKHRPHQSNRNRIVPQQHRNAPATRPTEAGSTFDEKRRHRSTLRIELKWPDHARCATIFATALPEVKRQDAGQQRTNAPRGEGPRASRQAPCFSDANCSRVGREPSCRARPSRADPKAASVSSPLSRVQDERAGYVDEDYSEFLICLYDTCAQGHGLEELAVRNLPFVA